jgi:hypothetical protein
MFNCRITRRKQTKCTVAKQVNYCVASIWCGRRKGIPGAYSWRSKNDYPGLARLATFSLQTFDFSGTCKVSRHVQRFPEWRIAAQAV